jgi:hypothetical protein
VCFSEQRKTHPFIKIIEKKLFVLWTRDSREGKLERENLRSAVEVHLKRLPGLEAHTTSKSKSVSTRFLFPLC